MSQASCQTVFNTLLACYGPQFWWPADSAFEVVIGALLTQNTNWRNVEKAIANLKSANMLDSERIRACQIEKLEQLIRPAGFFRQKAGRLQILCDFFTGHEGLAAWPLPALRHALLKLNGIGPETADSIMLYALNQPTFVVDSYTRRIFSRLGLIDANATYQQIQNFFHQQMTSDIGIYQEYHALIVEHAKRFCRAKPLCCDCPLSMSCQHFASMPLCPQGTKS